MTDGPADHRDGPGRYEIRVRGHVTDRWADWFEGFRLERRPDGTTVLDGPVVDQSALHGVLRTLADLGLPLVSVTPAGSAPSTRSTPPDGSSSS